MNKVQKQYMVAKSVYTTLATRKGEMLSPFAHLLDSDSGIEEYTEYEMKFDAELNLETARQNLRKAEDEMVDWAIAKVKASKHYSPKFAAAISEVVANRNKPGVHYKLVDMSFRLI